MNGVHLHHVAVGIPIVLVSGLIEIAVRPGRPGAELLAIAFGVGGAFILDEFALCSTCASYTGRSRDTARSTPP